MRFEFWKGRWDQKEIGFHEGKPNALLVAHADRLHGRILAPLAGKAVDLVWLAARGHEIVGIEFVQTAIDELFQDQPVRKHVLGGHDAFTAGGITMVRADMFDMTPAILGRFDIIYDRAALVALEPSTRKRYVETCRALSDRTFLIAFAYDQSKSSGPPFSVDEATVRDLHAGSTVENLETRAASVSARLQKAGIASIDETAYLIASPCGS